MNPELDKEFQRAEIFIFFIESVEKSILLSLYIYKIFLNLI
jgi:hypothetical protein